MKLRSGVKSIFSESDVLQYQWSKPFWSTILDFQIDGTKWSQPALPLSVDYKNLHLRAGSTEIRHFQIKSCSAKVIRAWKWRISVEPALKSFKNRPVGLFILFFPKNIFYLLLFIKFMHKN